MKIIETKPLFVAAKGERRFLTMYSRMFEHNGHEGLYFMVGRGDGVPSHEEKRPDAVIIHAIHHAHGHPNRLVLTNEFRVPLGTRELGFPAGLIEAKDYGADGDVERAAKIAAAREFHEETGMNFEPLQCSPPNLYSSAGMSNESAIIVFGRATGEPCYDHCEQDEDIQVVLATSQMCADFAHDKTIAHSKGAYPFILAFANMI